MQAIDSEEDGVWIVRVTGEIDLHTSPDLRAILQTHAEAKRPALIVDFSGVEYIDSSGLATLVEYVQQTMKFRGKFALAAVPEKIRTVFDMARLEEIFPIHATVDEAKAAVGSRRK